MITTKKGTILQAKAQTGVKLEFTKVMFGDGLPDDAILADKKQLRNFLKNLTGLISPKMTTDIQSISVVGDGTSVIRTIVSNANLDMGFLIREISVWALDPDEGEILYSVDNFGYESDYMPAKGGSWVVEQELSLITIIGNAKNVTAVISLNSGGITVEVPNGLLSSAQLYYKLLGSELKWRQWPEDTTSPSSGALFMSDGTTVSGNLELSDGTVRNLSVISEINGK